MKNHMLLKCLIGSSILVYHRAWKIAKCMKANLTGRTRWRAVLCVAAVTSLRLKMVEATVRSVKRGMT